MVIFHSYVKLPEGNRHSTTRKLAFLVGEIPRPLAMFSPRDRQGCPDHGAATHPRPRHLGPVRTGSQKARVHRESLGEFLWCSWDFCGMFWTVMGFSGIFMGILRIYCQFSGIYLDFVVKNGRINCPIEGWSYKFRDIIGTNIFNWICGDSIILIQNHGHGRMDTNTQVIVGMYADATHVHGTPVWMEKKNRESTFDQPGIRIMLSSMENVESISPTRRKKLENNN